MFFTDRQLKILHFIRSYILDHELSPTLEEIADHFQISRVTAHEHVKALEKKGALRKTANQARSIQLANDPREAAAICTKVPICGSIVAGTPVLAIENREELDLSTWLPADRSHFALVVRGDSMMDDGIRDGDVVIVERRSVARDGETVVAMVDGGETTLKRLFREKDGFRLQPANPSMHPIFAKEVEVQGVMVGLLRRYVR